LSLPIFATQKSYDRIKMSKPEIIFSIAEIISEENRFYRIGYSEGRDLVERHFSSEKSSLDTSAFLKRIAGEDVTNSIKN
jgi:hypothetical protein